QRLEQDRSGECHRDTRQHAAGRVGCLAEDFARLALRARDCARCDQRRQRQDDYPESHPSSLEKTKRPQNNNPELVHCAEQRNVQDKSVSSPLARGVKVKPAEANANSDLHPTTWMNQRSRHNAATTSKSIPSSDEMTRSACAASAAPS